MYMAAAAAVVPPSGEAAAFKLGFIGAGNLAESIARGVAKSSVLPPSSIRTAHRRPDRRAVFQSFGVRIFDSNAQAHTFFPPPYSSPYFCPRDFQLTTNFCCLQVVDDSDVVIISVKPQAVKHVLLELRPFFTEEKLLVSIAAGIKMKDLQEWSGQRRLIRVMPNTPSAVGQAASVMCMGEMATKKDEERVASLFSAIGRVWKADEKYFDAITGLSGSGPAYVYLAIEALADGGVAAGLPRDLALGLATQTVLGAAAMVGGTGKHPGQLKDEVTSPAGTTIAGIQELERGAFRGTLINAVVAATKRCRELSQT
ncbi:Pyrroline-5-carboxylate reductase [Ananas comosus]|uniref:Pyrroline-5-carboxylate reductase n=1 Tax=Ananas comosus TaxID=4615 RepID=A0A199VXL5_ANACO|nr:Pyrroline-5-carboxylate reductase [Ananas comosus]